MAKTSVTTTEALGNAFEKIFADKFQNFTHICSHQGEMGHLLQKPVLGVELPEEVEDPRSVKLVP